MMRKAEPMNLMGETRAEMISRLLTERDAALAEVERARKALKWAGEVYPARTSADGARVEMTWAEFNAMREFVGLPRSERYAKEEKAGIIATLRALLAAYEKRYGRIDFAVEARIESAVNASEINASQSSGPAVPFDKLEPPDDSRE